MKHTLYKLSAALIVGLPVIIFPALSHAQKYVVDLLMPNDSASVYTIERSKSAAEVEGALAFKIPNGTELTVTRVLDGNASIGVIKQDGKEYCVRGSLLIFSEDNPEGVSNLFPDLRKDGRHTAIERFFVTMTPYWIIALLFVAAIAFAFLGRMAPLRGVALVAIPLCILFASIMEIWAYATIGSSAFWWCDYDRYGFWGSFFRAIPYVAFVAFQIFSIRLYERILFGEDSDKKISIKPMAISMGACIPLTLIAVIAGALWWKSANGTVAVIVFLLSLGIGTVISFHRNIKILGKVNGVLLSIFTAIYIIGAIIAIWGLIVLIFKLILQVLMIVGAFFLMAMMSTTRYRDSSGNVYEEDGFGNRRKIN